MYSLLDWNAPWSPLVPDSTTYYVVYQLNKLIQNRSVRKLVEAPFFAIEERLERGEWARVARIRLGQPPSQHHSKPGYWTRRGSAVVGGRQDILGNKGFHGGSIKIQMHNLT